MTIVNNATVTVGENITIRGTLKDEENNIVPDTVVDIIVDSYTAPNVRVDENGNYEINITSTKTGVLDITVMYTNHTTTYISSTNTSSVTVNSHDASVKADSTLTINGILHDDTGNIIGNTKLTLRVDDDYIDENIVVDKNRNYEATYTSSQLGQHTIRLVYTSDNTNYTSSINSSSFTVESVGTNITINHDKTVKAGTEFTINGTVKDNEGNSIKNTKVTVNIDTQTITAEVDNNGNYETPVTLNNRGTYTITVTYSNDTTQYTSSTNTSTITVNSRENSLTLDNNNTIKAAKA